MPDQSKIELVHLLERVESIHPILTEALMEAATQAVDNIFLKVQFRLTVRLGLLAFKFLYFSIVWAV